MAQVAPVRRRDPRADEHTVAFYDTDDQLIAGAAAFLIDALEHGGAVVIAAEPVHERALRAAIVARGLAVDALTEAGRYQSFVAAELLDALTVDGAIDRDSFTTIAGRIIERAVAAGGPVHVFGEMVELLWRRDPAAALGLESLWNDLAVRHHVSLYCAYALASIEVHDDLVAVQHVCDSHSAVVLLADQQVARATGVDAAALVAVDEVTRIFVPAPTALRGVRRFVAQTMTGWRAEQRTDEVTLVACELAANAVQHAHSPFRLSIARTATAIRIAVDDTSVDEPALLGPSTTRHGGRGIAVVAALAESWGAHHEGDGKTVWAEIAVG